MAKGRGGGRKPTVFVNGKVRRTLLLHPETDAIIERMADEARVSYGAYLRAIVEAATDPKSHAIAVQVIEHARGLIEAMKRDRDSNGE